jgi:hypothetical protein
MSVATMQMKEEEIMTDMQFKAILDMVLQILSRAEDLEDAKKALLAIRRGEDPNEKEGHTSNL